MFPPVLYHSITMPDKEMVSSKMGSRTVKRLEKYKDREGISKSQAVERMVKQGLDVEESDMRLVPVKTDGGTKLENQLDSVENRIQSQGTYQEYLNIALAVSVLWFVVYFTFDLSPFWTGVTGLPLVGVLGLLLYKNHTGGKHE